MSNSVICFWVVHTYKNREIMGKAEENLTTIFFKKYQKKITQDSYSFILGNIANCIFEFQINITIYYENYIWRSANFWI